MNICLLLVLDHPVYPNKENKYYPQQKQISHTHASRMRMFNLTSNCQCLGLMSNFFFAGRDPCCAAFKVHLRKSLSVLEPTCGGSPGHRARSFSSSWFDEQCPFCWPRSVLRCLLGSFKEVPLRLGTHLRGIAWSPCQVFACSPSPLCAVGCRRSLSAAFPFLAAEGRVGVRQAGLLSRRAEGGSAKQGFSHKAACAKATMPAAAWSRTFNSARTGAVDTETPARAV